MQQKTMNTIAKKWNKQICTCTITGTLLQALNCFCNKSSPNSLYIITILLWGKSYHTSKCLWYMYLAIQFYSCRQLKGPEMMNKRMFYLSRINLLSNFLFLAVETHHQWNGIVSEHFTMNKTTIHRSLSQFPHKHVILVYIHCVNYFIIMNMNCKVIFSISPY